jgi:hypothetical protein
MAFCNCGEFIAAKVGNSFCNFVHFYFTTNIEDVFLYASDEIVTKYLTWPPHTDISQTKK